MHIVVENKQNTVTPFRYFPPMKPICVTLLKRPSRKLLPVSHPNQGTRIPQAKQHSGLKKKSLVLPFYSQSHLSFLLPLEAPGNH